MGLRELGPGLQYLGCVLWPVSCVCVCLVKAFAFYLSLCVCVVCLRVSRYMMEKVARARRARAHKRQAHTLITVPRDVCTCETL